MSTGTLFRFHSMADLADAGFKNVSIALGVFDGVHLGHRKVLTELLRISGETKSTPVAVTFDPHPRFVITGHATPSLLVPLSERVRLLKDAGAEAVVVIHFTRDFSILTPEQFLNRLLHAEGCRLSGFCVGSAWRFGCKAAGNAQDIRRKAEQQGFVFSPVEELMIHDRIVSSSAIRIAVAAGKLERAAEMLGRNYTLFGKVVHGMHLAGPKLGHPTANLRIDTGVLPPFGVYAVRAAISGEKELRPAIASIGLAPTIRENASIPRVEVHLLDFNGDLYGQEMSVELIQMIRPEQKFSSMTELCGQIQKDTLTVRSLFSER